MSHLARQVERGFVSGGITARSPPRSWRRGIAIKPYAAMGALHGPLDGIFDIMANHPFAPEDVRSVDVERRMPPTTTVGGCWSVRLRRSEPR